MPKIKIDRDKCKSCGLCIKFCPKGLLKFDTGLNKRGVYPVIFIANDTDCLGCGFCAIMCPDVCIEIK